MGLDMYLEGKKFFWTDWHNAANNPKEDGFEIKEKTLRLGYWRKHPNLHGFIVQTFANGVDDCQEIELDAKALRIIIEAVKENKLPETDGFFFGHSESAEEQNTLVQLQRALDWLQTKEERVDRSIVYRASW